MAVSPLPLKLLPRRERLLERGIIVYHETIRRWSLKFGTDFARCLWRKPTRRGDVWHLDEVRIVINGKLYWLWRAVDQDGCVLDEILQSRRNTRAARRLLTRLLRQQGVCPKRLVTDRLGSRGAARHELRSSVKHISHKGMNNRTENSHLPLRKRERVMHKFRSPGGCQRFVSVFSAIGNLFVPPASSDNALARHIHRVRALVQWKHVSALGA